jgi:hypothetical protein
VIIDIAWFLLLNIWLLVVKDDSYTFSSVSLPKWLRPILEALQLSMRKKEPTSFTFTIKNEV